MQRDVSVRLEMEVSAPARLVLAVAVAGAAPPGERLSVTQGGESLQFRELEDRHGARLHVVDAPAGPVRLEYAATVHGHLPPEPLDPLDEIRYLRPSRYCESDTLRPVAVAEFGGLSGAELVAAVSSWVGVRLAYLAGSSLPTDGAVRTYLGRKGVCRDFAHLVVAFLRALDVPARVVSVYAPGLSPMDFHAVAEAVIDGRWCVVDATALAPRGTMLRIATGRDAADTAFLTTTGDRVALTGLEVTAVADALPDDDVRRVVALQ